MYCMNMNHYIHLCELLCLFTITPVCDLSVETWGAGKQGGDDSGQTDCREQEPAPVRDRPGVPRCPGPYPREAPGKQRQLWVEVTFKLWSKKLFKILFFLKRFA